MGLMVEGEGVWMVMESMRQLRRMIEMGWHFLKASLAMMVSDSGLGAKNASIGIFGAPSCMITRILRIAWYVIKIWGLEERTRKVQEDTQEVLALSCKNSDERRKETMKTTGATSLCHESEKKFKKLGFNSATGKIPSSSRCSLRQTFDQDEISKFE